MAGSLLPLESHDHQLKTTALLSRVLHAVAQVSQLAKMLFYLSHPNGLDPLFKLFTRVDRPLLGTSLISVNRTYCVA